MNPGLSFQSAKYKTISWTSILEHAFNRDNHEIPILLCAKGWIMYPESYLLKNKWNIILANGSEMINIRSIKKYYATKLDEHSRISKIYTENTESLIQYTNPVYEMLCHKLTVHIAADIHVMFEYLIDHLRARSNKKGSLIQSEVIELEIATLYSNLIYLNEMIECSRQIENYASTFNKALKILYHIAILSGGRAILNGHSLELLYYTKLFQKIFLPTVKEDF